MLTPRMQMTQFVQVRQREREFPHLQPHPYTLLDQLCIIYCEFLLNASFNYSRSSEVLSTYLPIITDVVQLLLFHICLLLLSLSGPECVDLGLLGVEVSVLLVLVTVSPTHSPPLFAHQQVGRLGADGPYVVGGRQVEGHVGGGNNRIQLCTLRHQ